MMRLKIFIRPFQGRRGCGFVDLGLRPRVLEFDPFGIGEECVGSVLEFDPCRIGEERGFVDLGLRPRVLEFDPFGIADGVCGVS